MAGAGTRTYKLLRASLKSTVLLVLLFAGSIAAYLGAAAIGTVWTANSAAPTALAPVHTVHIVSNGFHSDIIFPMSDGKPPDGLPVLAWEIPGKLERAEYLIVGWGSRTAYTSRLDITEFTADIIAKSLLFDSSVMHVQPYAGRLGGPGIYRIQLNDRQYRNLIAFVASTFETDNDGNTSLLLGATLGYGDVFYRARPTFTPFYTCNAWLGEALRRAGVEVGRWTPFAQSIEWNLEGFVTARE